ncbi:TPA: hypothetical protein N6V93_004746 [Escherichia coli]|nr:hypothetical protein [Escherichia coli]HCN6553845.1 hypothetical protein [Escherichia coli]
MKIKLKNLEMAEIQDGVDFRSKDGDILEVNLPTYKLIKGFGNVPEEDIQEILMMLILDGTVFVGEGENAIAIPGHFYEVVDEEVL